LSFEILKESYSGAVRNVKLGQEGKSVVVGGGTAYPFYLFEGKMPNKPKIAMEVWDMEPDEWPESAIAPFKDVISDPAAWAKKCATEYGADMIVVQLKSTDPNGKNASPDDAAAIVNKVLDAVSIPVIAWGTGNVQKDEEVLKKVCEATQKKGLTIGPVDEKNHKGIGAAALAFGQSVISSSPIDVNIAKQVNILLENLGVSMDKTIIDPTTGGLGYGLEYSYSVMERLRMAGIVQGDDKLQGPMISNIGNEVWKSKEAKQTANDAPTLGDPEKRAILMESVAAVSYLLAGSDIVILRHPETVRMVKSFIDLTIDGGTASSVDEIKKRVSPVDVDLVKLSPKPDLTIKEEEKPKAAPAAKKPAAPPKAAPAPAPKAEAPKQAAPATPPPAAAPAAAAPSAPLTADTEARIRAEIEAKLRAEMEIKMKAETDLKAKADAEEKAKADAEAKKKAEDAAKKKAEEEAKMAKLLAEEDKVRKSIRDKRIKEKESAKLEIPPKYEGWDLLLYRLDRMHKRNA